MKIELNRATGVRFKYFIFLIIFLSFIFLAGFVIYKNKTEIYKLLDKFQLIPRDERFTELYFEIYPRINKDEVVVGKKVDFSFAIRNLEGQDFKYEYQVYFKSSTGTTKLISFDTVAIKEGDSLLIPESFKIDKKTMSGKVVVYLKDLNQEIFFAIPTLN